MTVKDRRMTSIAAGDSGLREPGSESVAHLTSTGPGRWLKVEADGSAATPLLAAPLKSSFRYVHEPLRFGEVLPWLGNPALKSELQSRVLHSHGGTFLITGFRGVGKSTLVLKVLDEIVARQVPAEVVLPVWLSVARSTSTERLLFAIVRRVFEALSDCGALDRLPPEARRALLISYMRTSLAFKETQSEARERTAGVDLGPGRGIAKAVDFVVPRVSMSAKRSQSLATEAAFLAYSETDVEYDLMRIVSLVGQGCIGPARPRSRLRRVWPWPRGKPCPLRLVIVLDEVDKLTADDAGVAAVEQLLSGIKNVLTMSGAHFLIVAGPDMHDRAVRDAARGNGVYESVFGWRMYVPCSWDAPDLLVSSLVRGIPPDNEWLGKLTQHLRFKARGVPRRLLQEFNSFVFWDNDIPYLLVDAADGERVEFYARLEGILQEYFASHGEARLFPVPIDEDRWRLGCYYVADWVLQSEGEPFSASQLLGKGDEAEFDPLLRLSARNVSQLLDHFARHGILEIVRDVVRDSNLRVTMITDVAEANARVYRLAADVQRAQFGFARQHESERAALEISLAGPRPPERGPAGDGPAAPLFSESLISSFPGSPPGSAPPPPPDEGFAPVPFRVLADRYELRDLLGQGGMGTVYAGEDRQTGQRVAVKVLRASMHNDRKAMARIKREAEICSKIKHPQIVQTYGVVQAPDGSPALVLELLDGPTLARVVEERGPLPPADAAVIGATLAGALAYLADAQIIRIDLKPSNVIMQPGRGPVIIDLGTAKEAEPRTAVTTIPRMIGTPMYMAPELIRDHGTPPDARADLYSLGLVIYFCLAGKSPFDHIDNLLMLAQAITEKPISLDELPISAEFRHVLGRLLERDHDKRPATALEARQELEATPEWQSGDEVIARGMPKGQYSPASDELAEAIRAATAGHGVTNIPGDDSRTVAAAAITGQAARRGRAEGVSRRPLHFIILADCSGRMKGEKIQALNYAVADMMPHLTAWERDQEQAQVFVRAIAFATEPWWHIPDPQPVAGLRWKPLQPVPGGLTNMGPAFAMAAEALAPGRIERRALRPALLLISDGLDTGPPGGFEAGLAKLMAQPAGKAALRLAIAIGRDAQAAALDRFIGDPSVPVLAADSTEDIADRLVAVSLPGSWMSEADEEAGADRDALARRLLGVADGVASRTSDQDTIM
jgi:uncharacterized protein YegL/DNA polymerase III delta prime subunit